MLRWVVGVLWAIGSAGAASTLAAQEVRTSVVGTVYDSIGKRHLDSAVVQLVRADAPGNGRTVVTDRTGRFRFDSVGAGSYILGFLHPVVDSLGLSTPMVHVRVAEPEPIRAMLAIPTAATIVQRTCGFPVDSGGLWIGEARSAVTRELLPGTRVVAQWSRIRVVGKGIGQDRPRVEGTADEDGFFRQCFMPKDDIVLAQAGHNADSSGVFTFTMPENGLLRRDVYIGPVVFVNQRVPVDSMGTDSVTMPTRAGNGRVVGRVTRPGGQALRGARLRVVETGAQVTTNDEGYFGLDSLPLGTYLLDARALGHVSMLKAVDIVSGNLSTVDFVLDKREVYLDTVKVIGRRLMDSQEHVEFLRRRRMGFGKFWDEDDIQKRNPIYVGDLMRMTPGVNVLPNGQVFFRSISGGRGYCQPTLFLDGMRLAGLNDLPIDALVNVQDIRMMEVYVRTAEIPAQYMTMEGCGSIVVWTGARKLRSLR